METSDSPWCVFLPTDTVRKPDLATFRGSTSVDGRRCIQWMVHPCGFYDHGKHMVRNRVSWYLLTTNRVLKRAIFRNESVYPNAHVFNPGRFLKDGQINPEVKDPEQLAFGYGRRYLHLL